jgi:hypothetical protein
MQGQAVPVSPRDSHLIHLKTLLPLTENVAGQVMQGQSNTAVLETLLGHINEHYNLCVQQGVPKEELATVAALVKNAGAALAKLKAVDAQAAEMSAQSQALDAEEAQQTQAVAEADAILPPVAPAAPA